MGTKGKKWEYSPDPEAREKEWEEYLNSEEAAARLRGLEEEDDRLAGGMTLREYAEARLGPSEAEALAHFYGNGEVTAEKAAAMERFRELRPSLGRHAARMAGIPVGGGGDEARADAEAWAEYLGMMVGSG